MIDENFKPWLIEVNTNPCLSLSSSYLAVLIPAMVDNAFRLLLDPIFPNQSSETFTNRFELVYTNERIESEALMETSDIELSDNDEY